VGHVNVCSCGRDGLANNYIKTVDDFCLEYTNDCGRDGLANNYIKTDDDFCLEYTIMIVYN
jgi:hypothetical protein